MRCNILASLLPFKGFEGIPLVSIPDAYSNGSQYDRCISRVRTYLDLTIEEFVDSWFTHTQPCCQAHYYVPPEHQNIHHLYTDLELECVPVHKLVHWPGTRTCTSVQDSTLY